MRPSLDKTAYLVVDDSVADHDDNARNVMPDKRHCDHELGVLVRQKFAVVVFGSQHPVADQRVECHYRRGHPT